MFVMLRTLFLHLGGLTCKYISTTSIFIAILFFAGIQSLIIGFLAIYIGLIHKEAKRRPLYFVDNAIGFDLDQKEEYENYHGRMSDSWKADLQHFGTDHIKEILEVAPYLIVVF